MPVTCDPLRTMVTLAADDAPGPDSPGLPAGTEIGFQEYFVQRHHGVPVAAVRFDGADAARPTAGRARGHRRGRGGGGRPVEPHRVDRAGAGRARRARRGRRPAGTHVVAVSPIVAGAALKGPADRMLVELGHEASVVGVARLYAPFAGTLVIDEADADRADAVEAEGLRCVVTPTVMRTPETAAALARTTLAAVGVETDATR